MANLLDNSRNMNLVFKYRNMKNHSGLIVEKAVRRSGISITELARRLKVDRKSIYNWFHQENLNLEIIARIGYCMNYDFSKDFPDCSFDELLDIYREPIPVSIENLSYWKTKYVDLLEKYNNLLSSKIFI